MRTGTRSALIALAVIGFAIALGVSIFQGVEGSRTIADYGAHTIDEYSLTGVVTAEVYEQSNTEDPDTTTWRATVKEVLWDRGNYPLVDGRWVHYPPPEPESTFQLDVLYADLVPGDTYTFALSSRTVFTEEGPSNIRTWRAHLALDQSGTPAVGTPESLAKSLLTMRVGDETAVETLIGFAREQSEFLTVSILEESPEVQVRGPRLQALDEFRFGPSATDSYLQDLATREPLERQLPTDQADLNDVLSSDVSVFPVAEWTAWHILVLLDDQIMKDMQWLGLGLDGFGYFGPVGLDERMPFVELEGFGPVSARARVMEWEGYPLETIASAAREAALAAAESSGERLTLAIQREALLDSAGEEAHLQGVKGEAGVYLLVDLREGHYEAKAVTARELLSAIERAASDTPVGFLGPEVDGPSEPAEEP